MIPFGFFQKISESWNINLIDTGQQTLTGGRLNRLKKFIDKKETCMLTYGDGISDINLDELLAFHKNHGKLVTVTAVRPPARFGAIQLKGDVVTSFKEKSQMEEGWINGGFFIFESEFLDFIDGDDTYLERDPLERAANQGELFAYKHKGFWQCMDTKRDHEKLESIYKEGAPWQKKK